MPGPVALNVFAPDEGNLHLLEAVGTPEQKAHWLRPMAEGHICSCFCMTEPSPGAGSDPGTLATTAVPDGDGDVIDGYTWFITGADGVVGTNLTGAWLEAPYCACKARLIQQTRAMALELARARIRVNALAPACVATALNQDFITGSVLAVDGGHLVSSL